MGWIAAFSLVAVHYVPRDGEIPQNKAKNVEKHRKKLFKKN